MSATPPTSPRWVLTSGNVFWPPSNTLFPLFVKAGTLIHCPVGSAMETAYSMLGLSPVLTAAQLGDGSTADRAWTAN